MKMRRRLAGALALAMLAQQQAQAQEHQGAALLTVDIVGALPLAGLAIERKLLPYPVQAATSVAIAQAHGDNLADFMARNLNGVNVNEISGSPFQNDITFRGFRASPVLGAAQGISVYFDGVRVNEPFGDVVNWDMLPEAAIGTLLLVPGSNPMYGLNTLGGALALTSKSGLSHPGLEFDLSTSNAGRRRLDLAYGVHGDGGWHGLVAATVFDDAGWREHSAGRVGNMFLKLGRAQGATDWSVTLLGGRSRLLGNGLLPSYRWLDGALEPGLYETHRGAAYTFPDITRNRLLQAGFQLEHRFSERASLGASAYARSSRRTTINGDISDALDDYVENCAAGFLADGSAADPQACTLDRAQGAALHTALLNSTSTRQSSQGASANLGIRLRSHRVNAGVSFDRSDVSFAQFEQLARFTPQRGVLADPEQARAASSSVTGDARAMGVYATDTWPLAPGTHLTASGRLNRAVVSNTLTTERGPQPHESFSYTKLNPALGVAHEAGAGVTLFANLAQSNRVPTVIELGCADPEQPCRLPVGLQSDPYLKQVVARTVETGARWQERGATLSASLYRTVNRDDILFLSSGPSRQGYFSNFGQTRHQGADLSATWRRGAVTARLSYNYLDATYDTDGVLFTGPRTVQVRRGTRIAGLPKHTFKAGLDWKVLPAVTLGADAQLVSNLISQGNEDGLREDPEEGRLPQYADWRVHGYALLNLRASVRPGKRWEFYARINNVFDRRYETFGAIATDLFPNGQLLQPHAGPVDAAHARFVAPGAPRSVSAGLRYHF